MRTDTQTIRETAWISRRLAAGWVSAFYSGFDGCRLGHSQGSDEIVSKMDYSVFESNFSHLLQEFKRDCLCSFGELNTDQGGS